jgi:hypothetical protein
MRHTVSATRSGCLLPHWSTYEPWTVGRISAERRGTVDVEAAVLRSPRLSGRFGSGARIRVGPRALNRRSPGLDRRCQT